MFRFRRRFVEKGFKNEGLLTSPGSVLYTFSKGKRVKGSMNQKISCFFNLTFI